MLLKVITDDHFINEMRRQSAMNPKAKKEPRSVSSFQQLTKDIKDNCSFSNLKNNRPRSKTVSQ
jgi:hypothetical protein